MPSPSDDTEFLDATPPHWAATGLSWFLLVLAVVAVIAVIVVRIPETVGGRFTLLPVSGVDPVRAFRDGVVARVDVNEGQQVERRAPLVVIRSSAMGDRAADRRTLETQKSTDQNRLVIAQSQRETNRRAAASEVRRLESRGAYLERLLGSKRNRLALLRELADSANSGVRRGSVGRLEAARLDFEASTIAEEIATAEDERDDVRAAIERIRQDDAARELEYQEIRRTLEQSIETARIRIGALGQDLVDLSDSGMVVLSPCAGTVIRLHVSSAGAIVREGEVLAEVGCKGAQLQAVLVVPETGLPMVQPGQRVKLRYDAFPFQRFGVRFGTVRWVGPGGSTRTDSASFRALVDLEDSTVRVRGIPRPLQPGMGGLGEVVTGKRSVLSYVFEPVRALRENLREAPATEAAMPADTTR